MSIDLNDRRPTPWTYIEEVYLVVLHFAFTLLWTTYATFLPKLAAAVAISPAVVIFIFMLDELIFTVTDTAMGVAADKLRAQVGKFVTILSVMSLLSCIAFLALPFVSGDGSQLLFLGLIVFWAATSSVLRSPPIALLAKYKAAPQIPRLAAYALLGYGLAGAVSPYLGVALREQDARIPFVVSSSIVLLLALALWRVERARAKPVAAPVMPDSAPKMPQASALVLGLAVLGLALGYQLHFSINGAPSYLRFAKPDDLQWLMPVFWVGFNLAVFPTTKIAPRYGELNVMGVSAIIGGAAIVAAELSNTLPMLIASQFVSGAAYGFMLVSAMSVAIRFGGAGTEGRSTGLVFSILALATFLRMAAVAGGLPKTASFLPLLHGAPIALWAVAGVSLLVISFFGRPAQIETPAPR